MLLLAHALAALLDQRTHTAGQATGRIARNRAIRWTSRRTAHPPSRPVPGSFNGRTADFGSVNRGSSPLPGAMRLRHPTPQSPTVRQAQAMTVSAIVLAAGEGTRMRSARPKPLHMICGRAMVLHVIHALERLARRRAPSLVVGHGAERVTKKVQELAPGVGQRRVRRAGRPARHRRRRRDRHDRVPRRRPRRRLDRRRAARRHPAAAARDARRAGRHPRRQRQRGDAAHQRARRPDRLRPRRSRHADGRVLRIVEQRDATPDERDDRRGRHEHLRVPARPARPGAAPPRRPTTRRASTT